MTMRNRTPLAAMIAVAALWAGCSSDDETATRRTDANRDADEQQIRAILHKTARRWHYADVAVLYEQEFEYLLNDMTYDEYIDHQKIKNLEADTVEDFVVKDIEFFEGDSAHVAVDVVFVGPTGDTTRLPQSWTMFLHRGRWIRPSLSGPQGQANWENLRREADSAAAAEENLGKDDW